MTVIVIAADAALCIWFSEVGENYWTSVFMFQGIMWKNKCPVQLIFMLTLILAVARVIGGTVAALSFCM
jgi:hypothetical protein